MLGAEHLAGVIDQHLERAVLRVVDDIGSHLEIARTDQGIGFIFRHARLQGFQAGQQGFHGTPFSRVPLVRQLFFRHTEFLQAGRQSLDNCRIGFVIQGGCQGINGFRGADLFQTPHNIDLLIACQGSVSQRIFQRIKRRQAAGRCQGPQEVAPFRTVSQFFRNGRYGIITERAERINRGRSGREVLAVFVPVNNAKQRREGIHAVQFSQYFGGTFHRVALCVIQGIQEDLRINGQVSVILRQGAKRGQRPAPDIPGRVILCGRNQGIDSLIGRYCPERVCCRPADIVCRELIGNVAG